MSVVGLGSPQAIVSDDEVRGIIRAAAQGA